MSRFLKEIQVIDIFVFCFSFFFVSQSQNILIFSYFYQFQKQLLEVFCKKGVPRNFAKFIEINCARDSFLIKKDFIKKESLSQVFSCEFCEISKKTFFTEHLRKTAAAISSLFFLLSLF